MPTSIKISLLSLVTFGLGFAIASQLPRDSATQLLVEPDGDKIRLAAKSLDEAYLVLESVDPPATGELAGTQVKVVGPMEVDADGETRIYKLERLMWCGGGECQPCGIRPDDDCPIPPAPPIPPLQVLKILVHPDLRLR